MKIIAGVSAVFLLGVCTGVLGTSIFIKRNFRQFAQAPPEDRKPFFMKHLQRELDLTDVQKPQVDAIIEEAAVEIRKTIQASRETIENILERNKTRLSEVLTSEQFQKLDLMLERMKKPPRQMDDDGRPPREMDDGPPPFPPLEDDRKHRRD